MGYQTAIVLEEYGDNDHFSHILASLNNKLNFQSYDRGSQAQITAFYCIWDIRLYLHIKRNWQQPDQPLKPFFKDRGGG